MKEHEAEGNYFEIEGLRTFRLDKGSGIPVLCLHGVPTSSYLYRKLIKSLAEKGHHGICIDLPGLGLTDRPDNFDYSFENFSDFLAGATQTLGIPRFHLVVHDIGGPLGFSPAAKNRTRILSFSILNT